MSCHVNKPVDGLRLPSARFFKMPSIFSLLPFIFQLPPTKNFLSIVKCWGKVQTVQLDKQTWNVWLKSSLLNWSAGHDLSTGSDCTPAVNSAGCGNCSGPSRALIRRAVKRAGPSKKVWCSRLGSRGDFWQPLRWLNRVMQDHEARASDLNRKLIFSFFLLFS